VAPARAGPSDRGAGRVGAAVPLVVGVVVEQYQSRDIPFLVTAALYVVGAFAWLAIDPNTPVEQPAL
jgi:fucose permease